MGFERKLSSRRRRVMHGQSAVYHVVNRIAFGGMLLDGHAKAVFVKSLRRQAVFSGIEILAYCVMTNHFHILIRVPEPQDVDDTELMLRYRCLYQDHCPSSSPQPDVLEAMLKKGGDRAETWRQRLFTRMHRLSPFMAELKQRFTFWYNHNRKNKGTVWSERFRSIIVEDDPEFTAAAAAYIDLNPVRAQLVEDPAEYGYSGYAAGLRGDPDAQASLRSLFHHGRTWSEAIRSYRVLLFGKGAEAKGLQHKDTGVIHIDRAQDVIARGGKLSWNEYLRMRVGYFSYGAILGSEGFVKRISESFNSGPGPNKNNQASPFKGLDADIHSLRNISQGIG